MPAHSRVRLPISTRHAFALAFDLAVRRDFLMSILVPLLLRAPWILANAALPTWTQAARADHPGWIAMLQVAALLGDFLVAVLIGGMLRFRARSVFNTPVDVHPAPAGECYALGARRVPWLVVTEIARNLSIVLATFFFVLPGVFLGFRLSFATEAVVLNDGNTESAFRHSFRITEGRFERWLEMIVASVGLFFGTLFVTGVLSLVFSQIAISVWVALARLLVTAVMSIIQYAWTFFYLRLVEIDLPTPEPYVPPGPLYAAAPPPAPPAHEPAAPPAATATPVSEPSAPPAA